METSLNHNSGLTGQSPLRQTDQLRPGAVLHATVESAGENGRYTINAGGLRLGVESKTPLASGMKLNLLVTAGKNGGMALQILPDSAQTAARLAAQSSATLTRSLSVNIPSSALFPLASLYAPQADSPVALIPQQDEEEQKAEEKEKAAEAEEAAAQESAEAEEAVQVEESAGQKRAKGTTSALPADGTRAKALAQAEITKDAPAPEPEIADAAKAPAPVEDVPDTAAPSANATSSSATATVLRLPISGADALRLTITPDQNGQPVLRLPDGEAIPLLPPDTPGETIEVSTLLDLLGGATASASSGGNFTASALTLFLQTALPDGTAAKVNLPLAPADLAKLLAALPAGSLAGEAISLQISASNPGQIEVVIGGQTFPLPPSATGTQIAALLTELPAGTTLPASISPNATLDGFLRTTQTEAQAAPARAAQETPAAALLRSSGLTPSSATLPAAEALMAERLNVSRENVQTLLALVAGREGTERTALLQAGARLLALEAPVSPALASGMASLLNPERSLAQQTGQVVANLQSAASALPAENATHVNALARQMETLSVLVGDAETPRALASFTATLGREVMGQVLQGIEQEAARQLGGSPALNALGAALEVVLARLSHLPENVPAVNVSATPAAAQGAQSPTPEAAAGEPPQAVPVGGKATQPSAVSVPPAPALPATTPASGTTAAPLPAAPSAAQAVATNAQQAEAAPPAGNIGVLAERLRAALELFNNKSSLGNAAAEVLAHPGIEDFPEYARPVNPDLRQPASANHERLLASLERIGHARTPAEAAQAAREAVRGMDSATLRELVATLQQAEREEITQLPGMKQLQDAATDLRELGRAFVAQKAEALALQRLDPAAFQTSVPLRFGEGSEDGKLQMFYRRQPGKGKGRDWTQRVVLDLNMSAIGNVVGDLRFYGGQLCVAMLSDDPQTVAALEDGAQELRAGLEAAGFPCEPGFRLIKKNEKLLERDLPAPEPASNQRIDVRI